ncbi:Helix-turn-helix domain protein [compost metagenome]
MTDFASLPDLLTVDETAEYLRVSRETIFSLIKAETLPALRVGKQFRISKDALSNLSTSNKGDQA